MNHTLLHHSYPFDYPLSDNEYLSAERPFANTGQLSSNDFLQSGRKNGIAHLSSSQSLAVPINTTFRHHSVPDLSLQTTSNPLLSPPDSLSGLAAANSSSTTSSIAFSTLPRVFSSNVSSPEPYSNAAAPFLPIWFDSSMSDYQNRPRPPAHFTVSSSPSSTYGHTNGIAGNTYQGIPFRGVTDPQANSYMPGRTSTGANPSDLGKYAQYSHPRSTDTFAPQFPSPNRTYRLPHTMSLEPLARPAHARQDSPPFEDTNVTRTLQTRDGRQILPEVSASIPKGFFQVDGKWTCYRRNYFPVSCAFSLKPDMPIDRYLYLRDGQQIQAFAMSISAKTAVMNNQESQTRGLVQHTPKRDKATESTPGKILIQAASPLAANTLPPSLNPYGATPHISPMNMTLNYEPFPGGQPQTPPTQYTFERIQFQKATANNGKRRAQQQYFHVVVELWVDVGRGGKSDWVEIATKQSHPMVVRGRSPGHYKDNGRRDSSTSMDPDRDAGGGGDGGGGMRLMPSGLSGRSHTSGMDWTSTAPRGSHSYHGTSYRQAANSHLSGSPSSSSTLAGSPRDLQREPKAEFTVSSPSDKSSDVDGWSTGDGDIICDSFAIADGRSKSRPYLEDCSFTPETREVSRHYQMDYSLPSHVDYATIPYSHALMI